MNDFKLPIIRPGELIRALERLGFSCTKKSKGSDFRYKHLDGRKTTVPQTSVFELRSGYFFRVIPQPPGKGVNQPLDIDKPVPADIV